MDLPFLCFLLVLSGGSTSSLELQDDLSDQSTFNLSSTKSLDWNTTSYQQSNYENQTSSERSDQSEKSCSDWDVLQHLNLTKNKEMFTMIRPVKNHKRAVHVHFKMEIYAILDVREADQSFISYISFMTGWINEFIDWNEEDYCGIFSVVVPRESLWMPSFLFSYRTEKDKDVPNPFLRVTSSGWVLHTDDKLVISTCKMKIFHFPFDIQSCKMTVRSLSYTSEELLIGTIEDNEMITEWSHDSIWTQYEWEFLSLSVTKKTVRYFASNQTYFVYTVTMQRKSALYVVNFLLPVLFFLCLDFVSLLMPTGGGDKISFKITVLLAVTVMQLILIEIIPFTTSRIPLIVIFCMGIFALMLLGLLETIFLNYLMEKDSSSLESKKESVKRQIIKASSTASTTDEIINMTNQTASMCKGDSSSQLTELFLAVEKVSDELGEMKKTFLDKESEEKKDGYWTRVAKKVDKIFSILYVLAAILFLVVVLSVWFSKSDLSE
ncbi:5-hydroxytryptamine receptor 3A-like [Poecilia formosa]|uniref:5-hydroxytryptamine receptor 3A-like n=1 Tax=Poecilia formosa TaxID=48698 RepID=UPI0007B7E3E2|nr:PREDICTED: 5-hydroxytryptamine receptor 3A-like [Poecilia formosa]